MKRQFIKIQSDRDTATRFTIGVLEPQIADLDFYLSERDLDQILKKHNL